MDAHRRNYLRVQNCIGTIIDVHRSIGRGFKNEDIVSPFEDLEKAIKGLDMRLVADGDILMVEKATNALLKEFTTLFEGGALGPIYGQLKS